MTARTITTRGKKSKRRLEPMDDAEFEGAVRKLRDDARTWMDQEVAPDREKMWSYYNGEVKQKAPADRSKAVLTEVRDAVEAVMVSLMRIFLEADRPVVFEPESAEDVPLAEQMTDVCVAILMRKNPGFRILSDAFRDALVAKAGVLKVWWDTSKKITEKRYEDLTQEEFSDLLDDEEIEMLDVEEISEATEADLEPGDPGGAVPVMSFNVKVRRTRTKGQCKVAAVPPDEFIFNKTAKTLEECLLQGQDRLMYAQDAVNEGLADWDDIEMAGAHGQSTDFTGERSARSGIVTGGTWESEEIDIASRRVRVAELYVRLDKDGDGIPELRRVIMLGDSGLITQEDVWDDTPYSMGSPFPTPHFPLGIGVGDLTLDLQEIATAVQRCMLDSLYWASNPRNAAVSTQVNIDDLQKNEFGGVVRTRAPGVIQPLTVDFVGRDALPVLEYLDGKREQRTGISKAAQGLDPQALQSSTEPGVVATLSAAQAKVESMARSLAEEMVAPTIQKMARIMTKYQKKDLVIRLRGEFVQVPVDDWMDMDICANVGLGHTVEEEDREVFTAIVEKQELILTTIGSDNPVVNMEQYSQGLMKLLESGGIKDTENYFNPPDVVEQIMALDKEEEEANPSDDLDPEARAKIEVEKAKQQAAAEAAQAQMQLDQQKQQAELALKREEMQMKMQLAREETQAKIQLAREQAAAEMELRIAEFEAEAKLEAFKVKTEAQAPGVGNIPTQ